MSISTCLVGEQTSHPELRQLVLLTEASRALAAANSMSEIKAVRDKAEALRVYAKSIALGLEAQNQAAEIKLRAERKAGRLLATTFRHGGDRKSRSHDEVLKLEDLQINRSQLARWKAEAAVPEKEFERYLAETKEAKKEVSSIGLRRYGRKLAKENAGGASAVPHAIDGLPQGGSHLRPSSSTDGASRMETAREARDHIGRLREFVDPICSDGNNRWDGAESRYVRRLYAHLGRLIDELTD